MRFPWNRAEIELDRELTHHLHELTAEYERQGHSHEEALRMAKREFGGSEQVKEQCRDERRWAWISGLRQDVAFGTRMMGRTPMITLAAVLSLALGIGANTAIFSFMDAILLRSLPVSDPGSLAVLNWRAKAFGRRPGTRERAASVVQRIMGRINDDPRGGVISSVFPYSAFEFLGKNNAVFSALFGYCPSDQLNVKVHGEADLGSGEYVSGDYFRALGVPPAAGRLITNDDDRAGAPPVAVVSFAYSQKRFGDPSKAVGATISVNNVLFSVIGVTAPEFFGVDPAEAPDVYLAMHARSSAEAFLDPHSYWLQMMVRLRPGVNQSQAQAAVAPMFQQWSWSPPLMIESGPTCRNWSSCLEARGWTAGIPGSCRWPVYAHISNIRRKLCLDSGRGIEIKNSRGHGYVLTVPCGRAREASSSSS